MEIKKSMYGLTQEGKFSNGKLKLHLYNFGYDPALITSGLWRHYNPPLQLSLVVYDYGVNMSNKLIPPIY